MAFDSGRVYERVTVEDGFRAHDSIQWHCVTEAVDTYVTDWSSFRAGDQVRQIIHGNVLANGGADLLWERLITPKPSTSSTGAVVQAFSTKAAIGVSTSATAAAASQTDLQGSTKWYKVMTTGYPTHTTGTSTAARSAVFRATFSTAQANIAWNEWGLFNTTVATRRMLNRKVQSLGTKTSAATRQITLTLTLS